MSCWWAREEWSADEVQLYFFSLVTSSIIELVSKKCCCLYSFTALRLNFIQVQTKLAREWHTVVPLAFLSWLGKWCYWSAVMILLDRCITEIILWIAYSINIRAWLCSCHQEYLPVFTVSVCVFNFKILSIPWVILLLKLRSTQIMEICLRFERVSFRHLRLQASPHHLLHSNF